MMIRLRILLPLMAMTALVPLTAQAAVSPGTRLIGNLDQTLNSRDTVVGTRFTISNVHTQSNDIHNATIYGHVISVGKPSQGRPASLELTYDKLHTLSGSSYALNAETETNQVSTKNNTVKEAGGALGGMVVGNVLGKWVGTKAGGAVGAAGGYLYAKNSRENVVLPGGSQVIVRVNQAVYKGVSR